MDNEESTERQTLTPPTGGQGGDSPTAPAGGQGVTITVLVADPSHEKYVDTILQTIADAAKVRGTGIAKRTHEYLATKMKEAKAVIALSGDRFAGFSYIET